MVPGLDGQTYEHLRHRGGRYDIERRQRIGRDDRLAVLEGHELFLYAGIVVVGDRVVLQIHVRYGKFGLVKTAYLDRYAGLGAGGGKEHRGTEQEFFHRLEYGYYCYVSVKI